MSHNIDDNEEVWSRALGPVYDRLIPEADVYLAGVDDLLVAGVEVIIRESAGAPGWVGVVDADLMPYKELKLELRLRDEQLPFDTMFTVGGDVFGRTLIRGSQNLPPDAPRQRSRPRVMPLPRELRPG